MLSVVRQPSFNGKVERLFKTLHIWLRLTFLSTHKKCIQHALDRSIPGVVLEHCPMPPMVARPLKKSSAVSNFPNRSGCELAIRQAS